MKALYIKPEIEKEIIDNEISMLLESPPVGPGEDDE